MSDMSLVRVGVLTSERYVHMGVWGPIIQPYCEPEFKLAKTRMTGMVMTHVWDIDKTGIGSRTKRVFSGIRRKVPGAQEFARMYKGIEVVENYYDMVGKVDGIILSDFDSCLHFKELAKPYLEAGIPIFINRPFALNLDDAQYMIDLAKQNNTPLMSGSSYQYAPEVHNIKREVEDIKPISGCVAANSMSDYPTHGIHGLFFMYSCLGSGIKSVSYQTPDWRAPNGIAIIEYEGRDGGKPFYACVQEITGTWGWIRVFGERTFEQFIGNDLYYWVPQLLEIQKMFETREMPESYETIYEKTQLFLAGFKSHVECGGVPVALSEIGDWQAPLLNPDPYPDGYFG